MVAARQKHAQPVQKITIVPHTQGALGYTMQLPEEEKFLLSKDDILTEIRTLLAGRAAEQVVFQTQTSGAANDIERATEIARKLVTQFGMSEKFGMVALGTVQNQFLDGTATMSCAQETFAAVDQEVMKIIASCYEDSVAILEENREMLDKVATYLLKKETITGQEMMAILDGKDPEEADAVPLPASSLENTDSADMKPSSDTPSEANGNAEGTAASGSPADLSTHSEELGDPGKESSDSEPHL